MLILLFGLQLSYASQANPPNLIPAKPLYSVLDEGKLLDAQTIHAIQSLLVEHERLTHEQIALAIYNKVPQADSDGIQLEKEWSHRLFLEWKIGKAHFNEGALLTLFTDTKHAYLETGYGLEPKLPENSFNESLAQEILSKIRHKDMNSAAIIGIYRILELIASPLIQSNRAIEILNQDGISTQVLFQMDPNDPLADSPSNQAIIWIGLCLLGTLLMSLVLYQILSREAHFTSSGWILVHPSIKKSFNWRSSDRFEGGGIDGHW